MRRRQLIAGMGALALWPRLARAEPFIDLDWADLVPEGTPFIPPMLQSILPHDETDLMAEQPPSSGVRTDWNGKIVRIPGYVLPLDFSGSGVTEFILVPYVGACVHVPPPPANQLVFVTTSEPYQSKGLFEAVNVTGMFGTAATSTQLAQIGYALSADNIEPF